MPQIISYAYQPHLHLKSECCHYCTCVLACGQADMQPHTGVCRVGAPRTLVQMEFGTLQYHAGISL